MSERYVFPRGPDRFEITGEGPQRYKWTCGMTIRRFYKAAALIALYAGGESCKPGNVDKDATWAGYLADAMIAEDEEHENQEEKP
jgi:hypothetical protein